MNNIIPTVTPLHLVDIVDAIELRLTPMMRLTVTNLEIIALLLKNLQ
jgi:hypothetical protein